MSAQTATHTKPPVDLYHAMTVTIPADTSGNVEIRTFDVTSTGSAHSFITGRGRGVPAGTYTGLYRSGHLWMSDTPDERRDHLPFLRETRQRKARRVLVNGLGLGMVIAGLLTIDTIEHIDVVEIDPDVIALVGPHYQQAAAEAGKTLAIHHGDAYTITWPTGLTWDCAWHDIWPHLCTDNLPKMAKLHRRYGRRVGWQDSWSRDLCRRQQQRERSRWGY